jgi:hypothetical protein
MKYLITESQKNWLLRRLGEIDGYVDLALSRVPAGGYNYHDYVDEIAWQVADEYRDLSERDINTILDYVRDNYWKKIEMHYLKSNTD